MITDDNLPSIFLSNLIRKSIILKIEWTMTRYYDLNVQNS